MTHLTATIAATAPGPMRSIDRTVQIHNFARIARQPAESVFYSPVANFLELDRAGSHTSVIGGHAMHTLAPGVGDSHISYDVSAAPNRRGDAAGARARAGDE